MARERRRPQTSPMAVHDLAIVCRRWISLRGDMAIRDAGGNLRGSSGTAPTRFKPAISAYVLSVVACEAHEPLPRQSRWAALQLQVVKEELHRADRF